MNFINLWYLKWKLSSIKDEIWEASRTEEQLDEEIRLLEGNLRLLKTRRSLLVKKEQALEKQIASLEQL